MNICKFLENIEPDIYGRMLSDIWNFTDAKIEKEHNFIQWVFPTSTPSISVPGSPLLEIEEIKQIRKSIAAVENLYNSSEWFFSFLERNNFWIKAQDHNHLRITRIIQSLRLLGDADEADFFREQVLRLLGNDLNKIPPRTIKFWKDA